MWSGAVRTEHSSRRLRGCELLYYVVALRATVFMKGH